MRTPGILAIDPGGTTGYCLLYNIDLPDMTIEIGEFKNWSRLDDLIRESDIVLCEQPFLTISTDPIVFEVTGAVKERCEAKRAKLIMQQSNFPHYIWKRYAAELRHKQIGTSFSQHKKDAFAHVLYYWVYKMYCKSSCILDLIPNKKNGQIPA